MAEEQNQDNRKHDEQELTEELTEETGGNGQAGDELAPEECSDQLAQKEQEIKSLQDRVLRIAAEMDNTRKRLERERSEGICFANESLIRALLPVLDNLERAIQHAEKDADPQTLLDGVKMTVKGFQDALSKFGCVPFESVGKPFDPNYHEAMMQQETADQPENIVLQEFQKGYTLHDRLIRPAMVVVSKEVKS
jgi:molecular chaperone GrpE